MLGVGFGGSGGLEVSVNDDVSFVSEIGMYLEIDESNLLLAHLFHHWVSLFQLKFYGI